MRAAKRQVEDWVREARRLGWHVEISRGHWKWRRPDGSFGTVTPGTPSNSGRSLENIRARLRRAGLDVR